MSCTRDGDRPPRVVVLGGGVCGLYAARVLAVAGVEVTLVERESFVGGLAASQERGHNFYDLGVHHLHGQDREILEDVRGLVGDRLNAIRKSAKIRFGKGYRDYPLRLRDLLTGLPPWFLLRATTSWGLQQARNRVAPRDPANAEEALVQLYGGALYEFFFKEFTHSYWGFPPTELSPEFVRTKMPRLSALDMARRVRARLGLGSAGDGSPVNPTLEETLYYGASGAGTIPNALADAVHRSGGRILVGAAVTGLRVEGRRVVAVRCDTQHGVESLACDECISTIPLGALCRMLEPPPPADVLEAASGLRTRPLAVLGLLVRKPSLLPALYVHFRGKAFHRASEPKLGGLQVAPADHSVLLVETTCDLDDERWRGDPAFVQRVVAGLAEEGILGPEDVVDTQHLRYRDAYPIFDLGFEGRRGRVLDHLAAFENLQSVGLQGRFAYLNMHTAMRQGADAARSILGRRDGSREPVREAG